MWPPNSPDLNPVDFVIWSVIQQHVYKTFDELRQRPTACVARLGAVAD